MGQSYMDRKHRIQEILKEWRIDPGRQFTITKGAAYDLEAQSPIMIGDKMYEVKLSDLVNGNNDTIVSLVLWGV